MGTSFGIQFILGYLSKVFLNQLLGTIKNLQMLTHLSLLSVFVPANAQVFFSYIFDIISFDFADV